MFLAFGVVRRRDLGASGVLNDCNAAKSSRAGLSDTSCIRSIPSRLAFTALKPFIPPGVMLYLDVVRRRPFIPPGVMFLSRCCTPQLLLICFATNVMPSRKMYTLRQSACYACLPLEGKVGAERSAFSGKCLRHWLRRALGYP